MRRALFPPALLIFLAAACSDQDMISAGPENAREVLAFFETRVTRTTIREPIYTTGTIIPDKATDITSTVSGTVEVVHVDVGDRVAAGRPLFELDQTDYRLKVKQLENSLALAKAELADARMDLDTNLDLSRRGAVSRDVLDNVKTRYEIARARLGIAEAQLAQARESLADTVVKAPFDGVISRRNVHEGAFVQARGGPPPLLQILKIDVVAARAFVPETELKRIAIGTPARVIIDGLGKSRDARIDIINDLVDEKSRSIEVRLRIDNPDFQIKPGLFTRVEIFPESRETLVLDRASIQGNNPFHVFVNDSGIARRTEVEIRELDTGKVEVLKGLSPGQKVLYGANLSRLGDSAPVRIIGG